MADNNFNKFMNSGLASNIIGTGLGLMLQGHNDRRQLNLQDKLNRQQLEYDTEKSRIQQQMQLDLWKQTSFPAQVEMMKKAGLNTSLMYGGSGGGSATIGGGMNSVNAPAAPSGGGEMLGMMMQKAQLDLMNAQARKTNAEADNVSGIDTDVKKAQEALMISQKEANEMDKIIKEYTGKNLADVYNKVLVPNRSVESKTYNDELTARQAVASNIYDLWANGKLSEKSLAEIESIELNNAKSREERKNIMKSLDILEENLKGLKIDNFMKDIERKWMDGTGLKGTDVKDGLLKILGMFMSIKK